MNNFSVCSLHADNILLMLVWMKKVETAKWEAQRPIDKLEARHAERMGEAERERYSIIKSVNDLEAEVQKLEACLLQEKNRIANMRSLTRELHENDTRNLEYCLLI
jgi:hypothetical protein